MTLRRRNLGALAGTVHRAPDLPLSRGGVELFPLAYDERETPWGTGGLLNKGPLRWKNRCTYGAVAITLNTPTNVPVLSGNDQRVALIIQNNSTAAAAGDFAPYLWVGFNAQAQAGAFGIPPGGGALYFDYAPPRDAIFVLVGAIVNPGGSVVVQGSVVQAVLTP